MICICKIIGKKLILKRLHAEKILKRVTLVKKNKNVKKKKDITIQCMFT